MEHVGRARGHAASRCCRRLAGRLPAVVVRCRHARRPRAAAGDPRRRQHDHGVPDASLPGELATVTRKSETAWRTLSSRPVYANKWISVREDLVALPDGRTTVYGVVSCGHCVGLLPFVDPDTVLLVRQYRYVAGRPTWEMPTGGVHAGETLEQAAQRELAEETGYRARNLVHVSTYHTSKSVVDETAHLFLADGLESTDTTPDETEFIDVRAFPFDTVLRMVLDGDIVDSMTIVGVLLAARRRENSRG
ncbi:MAG: NUDIX hydrolase [Candidatus Rokuibacteriota bacterium]|nr:MAG: NUDIX hydrolase [Candidatus Rokubacteria bacterium]